MEKSLIKFNSIWSWCSLAALVLYTLFVNNKSFYYDEPYYLSNIALLNKFGLSREFYLSFKGPAGPLHCFLHWILQPITKLRVIPTRLVNIVLLIGTIITVNKIGFELFPKNKLKAGSLLLGIPMTFVCSGMALTEMPALFCLSISFLLLLKSDKQKVGVSLFFSAVFLSLAIVGRQPYLLLIAPYAYYLFRKYNGSGRLIVIAGYFIIALLYPVYLFSIWHGVVPPIGGDIATKEHFSIPNFLMGIGYTGLIIFILKYQFFKVPIGKMRWLYIVAFVATIILCFIIDFQYPVMTSFMGKIFNSGQLIIINRLFAAFIIMLGVYLIHMLCLRAFEEKIVEKQVVFLSLILMVLSNITITHQFSSRYVFQNALFIVIVCSYDYGESVKKNAVLRVIGTVIGMLSLNSYMR
jgi:hypothetical protein